jgi:hypothetical protein
MGGEIIIGYKDGSSEAFSEYGHKPWQEGYKDKNREKRESEALYRFQAEWAAIHGRRYTASNAEFGGYRDHEDSDEMMETHRVVLKKYKARRK